VKRREESRPAGWRIDLARLAAPRDPARPELPSWLRLTPAQRARIGELLDELARAASLATFIDQDAMTMPPADVARRVRALLAANDRPQLVVWLRALTRRLEGAQPGPSTLDLATVRQELAARFEDPKAKDTRAKLEQKISSAKILKGRAASRQLDILVMLPLVCAMSRRPRIQDYCDPNPPATVAKAFSQA